MRRNSNNLIANCSWYDGIPSLYKNHVKAKRITWYSGILRECVEWSGVTHYAVFKTDVYEIRNHCLIDFAFLWFFHIFLLLRQFGTSLSHAVNTHDTRTHTMIAQTQIDWFYRLVTFNESKEKKQNSSPEKHRWEFVVRRIDSDYCLLLMNGGVVRRFIYTVRCCLLKKNWMLCLFVAHHMLQSVSTIFWRCW